MRNLVFLLLLGVFTISCNKSKDCGCVPPPNFQNMWLNAKVVETDNIDCHKPVIEFDTADLEKIHALTGKYGDSYLMVNFPSALNQLSKRIQVKVMVLPESEDFSCTTLGPSYNKLKTLDAQGL